MGSVESDSGYIIKLLTIIYIVYIYKLKTKCCKNILATFINFNIYDLTTKT